MKMNVLSSRRWLGCTATALALGLGGCAGGLPPAPTSVASVAAPESEYRIGPMDVLQVNVWRAPELSGSFPVRPDGRITTPLLEDVVAVGKTPTQLAREIEEHLKQYVHEPSVTVIASGFSGPFDRQVRVVGEAAQPRALPYRANMTLLDVMIEAGGLTQFAAGNRAVLARGSGDGQKRYSVRLDDLLRDGDTSANVPIMPGDVLIIPQSYL
jgi:polysaccharide export outer membrane protein